MNTITSITNRHQRLISFDVMKCFAIFLVIWGHCIGGFTSTNLADLSMYRIIYSFHMPLFMMISGYFAFSSMTMSVKDFLKKKFRQLLYPCLTIGTLIWLFLESTHSFHYQRNSVSISGLLIDFYWFSDFWFLKSCFICYTLAYLGIRSKLKKKYWILFTLLISQCFVPFFVSFMYPCFLIGMELYNNNNFRQRIFKYRYYISSIFIIMLFFYTADTWNYSHGIPDGIQNANIETWLNIISNRVFRLCIGIIGALSFFTFSIECFKIKQNNSFIKLFGQWGQITLEVYLLQAVFLEKILTNYIQFDNLSPFIYYFIITPIISISLLYIFVFLVTRIYKTRHLGTLLFGKPT